MTVYRELVCRTQAHCDCLWTAAAQQCALLCLFQCPHACELLYYLTRREDVKRHRIETLLLLQRRKVRFISRCMHRPR